MYINLVLIGITLSLMIIGAIKNGFGIMVLSDNFYYLFPMIYWHNCANCSQYGVHWLNYKICLYRSNQPDDPNINPPQ